MVAKPIWAAQFFVASELIRRGYTCLVHQRQQHSGCADLMVGTPSGGLFWVDVKGLAGKNDWLGRGLISAKP
jgi:hypothetical protein